MRKVLVALIAIVTLGLAGALVAAPKMSNKGHQASAGTGLDIFALTHRSRDLPEESYPAH